MHSYCMKLFYCKNLLCLRKERLHIPTLFFYFLFSAPAFLVPATVSCARIPGVFIDNRMCLININTFFYSIWNMWPIWLSFWGRFDLGPIWLGPTEDDLTWSRFDWKSKKKSLCKILPFDSSPIKTTNLMTSSKSILSLHCLYSLFFSLTILFLFRISVVWYVYLYSYRMWICYVLLYTCVSEFV